MLRTLRAQKLFVGLLTTVRPGWEKYFADPKVDGRLTDPAKIRLDMEKKLSERAAEAPWQPLAAMTYEVAVLEGGGEVLLHLQASGSAATPDVANKLCELLEQAQTTAPTSGHWLYGVDLPRLLRLVWLESAAQSRARGELIGPEAVWRTGDFTQPVICDPYAAALNTVELRNQISPGALASYLGIDYPENFGSSALSQAQFARNLTLALGL